MRQEEFLTSGIERVMVAAVAASLSLPLAVSTSPRRAATCCCGHAHVRGIFNEATASVA